MHCVLGLKRGQRKTLDLHMSCGREMYSWL